MHFTLEVSQTLEKFHTFNSRGHVSTVKVVFSTVSRQLLFPYYSFDLNVWKTHFE